MLCFSSGDSLPLFSGMSFSCGVTAGLFGLVHTMSALGCGWLQSQLGGTDHLHELWFPK